MKDVLVSVVIPFYSKTLGELTKSINSLINQSYENIEIVIVDDCSPIRAADELSLIDLKNISILIIENKKNMNASYCRNEGIKQSGGSFISLLDAGDYFKSNHIEDCLKEIYRLNAQFIYSDFIIKYNNSELEVNVSNHFDYVDRPADFLLDTPPQTNSFFFNKECFDIIKFDESLNRHQDYQFLLDVTMSDLVCKKTNINTSYYIKNDGVKNVDFESVVKFWSGRLPYSSHKKLKKYMVNIVIQAYLNNYDVDFILDDISNKVLKKNAKGFDFIKNINSSKLRRAMFFCYFYLYLDISNLNTRIQKLISNLSAKNAK